MLWLFRREPRKEELQAHRKVGLGPYSFTIRRINPFLDFEPDRMPQIFALPRRKPEREDAPVKPAEARRMIEDMVAVLEAGVVSPRLVPVGRGSKKANEEGITAEDLLRWDDIGALLYTEIIAWSLVKYRGVRGSIQMSAQKAAMLDLMAKRYGMRPSDIAFAVGEASEAEKQMLDVYAASHGAEAEKKAASEAKRG